MLRVKSGITIRIPARYFHVLLIGAAFWPAPLTAQQTAVIVASGGVFETMPPYADYATVGLYDPGSGDYVLFDTIFVQAVSSVTVDGDALYVAAADSLVCYDLRTLERIAANRIPGVRRIAPYQDRLLATIGYGGSPGYVKVLDKTTLAVMAEFISDRECEGIVIAGHYAYIGEPGAFGSPNGSISKIDLQTWTFDDRVDLDSMGRGIGAMYFRHGSVMALNSVGWMENGNITYVDTQYFQQPAIAELQLPVSRGIALNGDLIYAHFGGGLGSFDIVSRSVDDTVFIPLDYAGGAYDSILDRWYLTSTDYFSYGRTHVFSGQGLELDSFEVGISPESIGIWYKGTSGLPVGDLPGTAIRCIPNPGAENVRLAHPPGLQGAIVEIVDLAGGVVVTSVASGRRYTGLDLSPLTPGLYLVRLTAGRQSWACPLVRR